MLNSEQMRRLFAIAGLLLTSAGPALAQSPPSPAQDIIKERLSAHAAASAKAAANLRFPERSPQNLVSFYGNLMTDSHVFSVVRVPSVEELPANKLDQQYLESLANVLTNRPYIWLPDREVRAEDYPQAIALIGSVPTQNGTSLAVCSGTVIAPNAILTAGHCVCDLGKDASAIIGTADLRKDAGTKLRIVGVRSRIPDCTKFEAGSIGDQQATLSSVGDVAVMFVAEDLTKFRIVQASISSAFKTKNSYYIVGYGSSDADPRPGTKRLATIQGITCDAAAAGKYGCNPAFEFWGDGRQITGRQDRPDSCGGDSGGPVFDTNGLTPPSVVGVISRPVRGTTCGQGGVYVMLDGDILAWVKAQTAARMAYLASGQ